MVHRLAVLVAWLVVAAAWASGCPMSAPAFADGCDGGEVELDVPADGGAPPPVAICRGAAAPADGVFLRTDSAADLAGRCAADKARADSLSAALKASPSAGASTLILVGAGALALGLVAGFVLAKR